MLINQERILFLILMNQENKIQSLQKKFDNLFFSFVLLKSFKFPYVCKLILNSLILIFISNSYLGEI